MKNKMHETRLKELEVKANRTPQEEAVRVALVALKGKEDSNAPQAELDEAKKALATAEEAM